LSSGAVGTAPGVTASAAEYLLGHSAAELERLGTQARVIDPITRRYFSDAGLAPGMRVLDVGSGVGDVAFLAAELVGPSGAVIGVDRAAPALAIARVRAAERQLANVSFREGDPTTINFDAPFDAVIGRYVLMFQQDPAATLAKLLPKAKPGALFIFHEPHWISTTSFPPAPTYDRCYRWITRAVELSGPDVHMGLRLHATFVAAGLPAPTMRTETLVGGGANAADTVHLLADLTRTLLPDIERTGVATAAEVGVDTLAERMLREAVAGNSVLLSRLEVGAWSRRPA